MRSIISSITFQENFFIHKMKILIVKINGILQLRLYFIRLILLGTFTKFYNGAGSVTKFSNLIQLCVLFCILHSDILIWLFQGLCHNKEFLRSRCFIQINEGQFYYFQTNKQNKIIRL